MLIPLFLTLFSHSKPITSKSSPHPTRHKAAQRGHVITAVKGEIQFVMLVPAPQFGHPSPASGPPAAPGLSPPRRLMPLTASFRLDTRAQEEREEEDLIAAINNERTQRGLGPLTEDPLLNVTARAHSREMCSLSYFDHHSPTLGAHPDGPLPGRHARVGREQA